MGLTNNDYDAGFLNVPGFGQSATNPLAPVFYNSLGVVQDLSVYQSVYAAHSVNAGQSFNVGTSSLSTTDFKVGVPTTFLENVYLEKDIHVLGITFTQRLVVRGKEYVERTIDAKNGTFQVLATV